jgi:uncharacterized ferritin-like protein (DUF455 family)
MNTINEYCKHILLSGNLEDKLSSAPENLIDIIENITFPDLPARNKKIALTNEKSKIPRLEHLNSPINRAICLHHFANHELMAIELFAYALLKFQNIDSEHRKDLFLTLKDEQKHFKLYLKRMNELGLDFGEKPLNSIFWKFLPKMSNFEKFSAVMSITFEGANLDYSLVYRNSFEKFEDKNSAEIMNIIYHDERKHVRRGVKVIENRPNSKITDWDYYRQLLDPPLTPRRAKGYFFIPDSRRKLGLSETFIQNLAEYKDEFSNRKKEVIPEEMLNWGIYTG